MYQKIIVEIQKIFEFPNLDAKFMSYKRVLYLDTVFHVMSHYQYSIISVVFRHTGEVSAQGNPII